MSRVKTLKLISYFTNNLYNPYRTAIHVIRLFYYLDNLIPLDFNNVNLIIITHLKHSSKLLTNRVDCLVMQ